jgi:predicted ATPase
VPELPIGTVTFVFTDIEGSTRLLHELGEDAYAGELAEHHRRVREAFEAAGGVEVDNQGDGFVFVFEDASDAVAAAGQAQADLAAGPVRVRMGIHTGRARLTEAGYVGLALHKGARIGDAGHGGQVLLSRATRGLVDAVVLDLGEHRLKDFADPESIFQLGEARFPPLKTLSNTNLPRPASALVGRDAEVADVLSLVRGGARLVTLSGPGGSGKTRLAIAASAELVPEFRNGVFWVDLSAVRDPDLVPPAMTQALGARENLAPAVGERELLLVLDNFEQVVAAAPSLPALLRSCPNLALLVTSRELLRVDGEVEYPVPALREAEAVELFCARSRLEADEAVASLCRQLDQMPLAVELAAARSSVLSPRQILERLSDRLDLLRGGRDSDPRQQTLRATIAWSHDLLMPAEQRLFARLSVFAGGFTVTAAEYVCDATLDGLESLVDKNLLRHTGERLWMLETILEFASERLVESAESADFERRHAEYFLKLFEAHEQAWRDGPESLGSHISLVLGERDNARRALDWFEGTGDVGGTARLVVVLHPLWVASSTEGRRILDAVLAEPGIPDDVRGRALWCAWRVAAGQGDTAARERYLEQALPLFERLGDRGRVAEVRFHQGSLAVVTGQSELGQTLLTESQRIATEIGDRTLLVSIATTAAHVPLYRGDFDEAERQFVQALRLAREEGEPQQVKIALSNLAVVALCQERFDEAAELFGRSLAIRVEFTMSGSEDAVEGLAAVAVARGDPAIAARLLGATAEWRQKRGFRSQPFEAELAERTAATARDALGEDAYGSAVLEGAALELDDAVELALTIAPGS